MKIGVPKEIKNHEYRVGLIPSVVEELTHLGHVVLVESNAGKEIGFLNENYEKAGATIVSSAAEIFAVSDMIVKVKEPQLSECQLLRSGQVLFAYLHLAPDLEQATALMQSDCIAIAYETVTDDQKGMPLLAPMSEVAGRMSIQAGAGLLEKSRGGSGVLLGGVPGVSPGKVVILGGGFVGENAARMAVGLGAQVVIFDKNHQRLKELDTYFKGRAQILYSTTSEVARQVLDADLVVGAVLVAGAAAPKILTKKMIQSMRPGSVVVDVAIDQGGCFETSRPTTHDNPTFIVDGVIHYCVTNMPGAVARTSTLALNNATMPFVLNLAQKGYKKACQEDRHLRNGLTVFHGKITHPVVAKELRLPYQEALEALSMQDEFDL